MRHITENLVKELFTTTEHWGVNGKVIVRVQDNASNMVLANDERLVLNNYSSSL